MNPKHPNDIDCPLHTAETITVPTEKKSSRLPRKSSICVVLAASLLFAAGAASAASAASKLDSSLATVLRKSPAGGSSARLTVIVQTRRALSPLMRSQVEALGGRIESTFTIIRGFSVSIPSGSLRKLEALPWVSDVSSNATVKKLDESADYVVGADYANTRWRLDGRGVTVAVLDSGVDDNPDFSEQHGNEGNNHFGFDDGHGSKDGHDSKDTDEHESRLIYGPNFSDETSPLDTCGHGTHVSGLIGGNGAMSTGPEFTRTFKGVAPGVRILAIKALNYQGQGTINAVLNGIQWCVQNREKYRIRVLNLSVGHPVYESYTTDPLCQAVEAAWKAGIVVVCAAGNDGRSVSDNPLSAPSFGGIESPANDPYVLTVGATNTKDTMDPSDDVMASYSSHGPTLIDHILKPDLVAPGNRLVSSVTQGTYLQQWSATNGIPMDYYTKLHSTALSPLYFRLSGTSMATAVVSGAAALLIEKDPSLTPDTVKGRLMKTAVKNWSPTAGYDYCMQGAGLLDIPAAISCKDIVSGYALSPRVIRGSNGSLVLQDISGSWGDSVIWSDTVIWSDSVVWGDSVIWDDSVVWGDSVIWGDSVVWGDSVIAGDSVVWGDAMLSDLVGVGTDISAIALYGD